MSSKSFVEKPSAIIKASNGSIKTKIITVVEVMNEIMERVGSHHKPEIGTALGNLVALARFLTKDGKVRGITGFTMAVTYRNVSYRRHGDTTERIYKDDKDENMITPLDNGIVCYEFEVILRGRGVHRVDRFAELYVPVQLLDLNTKQEIGQYLVNLWRPYLDEEYSRIAQTLTRTAGAINKLDEYDLEVGGHKPVDYGKKLARKSKVFNHDNAPSSQEVFKHGS